MTLLHNHERTYICSQSIMLTVLRMCRMCRMYTCDMSTQDWSSSSKTTCFGLWYTLLSSTQCARMSTCVCYTYHNMQTVSQLSKERHTGFYLFFCVNSCWLFGSAFTTDLVTSSLSRYSRHSYCETAVSQLPTVEAYHIAHCLVCGRKEWQVESCSRPCAVLTHTHTYLNTKFRHVWKQ